MKEIEVGDQVVTRQGQVVVVTAIGKPVDGKVWATYEWRTKGGIRVGCGQLKYLRLAVAIQ